MTAGDRSFHRLAVGIAVALLLLAPAVAPAAAQETPEPAVVVEVAADGSADLRVVSTFDLTTDAEREAFRTLADDEAARADATARFRDRMAAVAADAQTETGREMAVTDASIDLRTVGDETGVVTLSVTITGLAAVREDTLVVTEPFASGFTADRPVDVLAPDGYEIVDASPAPESSADGRATWAAGADLDGFTVEMTETAPAGDGATQSDGQPGFGAVTALLAVLVAAAAARLTGR